MAHESWATQGCANAAKGLAAALVAPEEHVQAGAEMPTSRQDPIGERPHGGHQRLWGRALGHDPHGLEPEFGSDTSDLIQVRLVAGHELEDRLP